MSVRAAALLAAVCWSALLATGVAPASAFAQEPEAASAASEAEAETQGAPDPSAADSETRADVDDLLADAQEVFESAGLTVERLGGLATRAHQIDRPRVGPVVDLGGSITVGRGVFRPGPSASVRLLLAGGTPVGVVVTGPGALDYRVDDRFSAPVARRNLGEGANLAQRSDGGALIISTPFDHAAVWGWELGARAAATVAAEALEAADEEAGALPKALADHLETSLFANPSTYLIRSREIDSSDPLAYALATGGSDDVLLTVDPGRAKEESLYAITGVSRYNTVQRGMNTLFLIATQPIGRAWWEREGTRNPLVLEHQSIELVQDRGDHVRSESTSRVRARQGGESLWRAGVTSHFFWDEKLHPVTVEEVLLDGQPADFVHRQDSLLVDLGRTLAAGDTVEIRVVIDGDLAKRPNNDSFWQPVGTWRPVMGLDGEFATYDITMTTQAPFVPFTSGDTVERSEKDGVHTVRSKIDRPAHFPVVVAGKYKVFSEEKNGYTCNIATYVFGKERGARVLHGLFFSAAEIFEQFFGVPYPFEELDVVEMNDWGWAQAPDGVIFITQEAYNPIANQTNRLYSQGINARFVHEVAHAWWGHVIKMDSPEEQWLTESFADYAAALAMKAMQPGKKGEREFDGIVRDWRAQASQVGEGGSIYLANYLDSRDVTDDDHFDRIRLLYNKGPLVLHALRQELGRRLGSAETGDRYFQALLRTFATNFENQYGETRHLVGILNQMTHDDWQPWFEKYVYGTETPEVEL